MAIKITDSALQEIRKQLEAYIAHQKNQDVNFNKTAFLRMAVKGGGCSGFAYELSFDTEKEQNDKYLFSKGKNEKDEEVEWGFEVVIDAKSYLYLNGTILDFATQGLQSGFIFKNPNAKSTCGCGTSFSADDKKGEEK